MFRNSNSLDLARMVLLGVIGVSWSVVISVGAFLIVQAYSEEISKGPPFADQAMAVAEALESTAPSQREQIRRAVTSRFFDISLEPGAAPASPDNFEASLLTFRFLTQNAFRGADRRAPKASEVAGILLGVREQGPEIDALEILLSDGTRVSFLLRRPFQRRDDLLQQLFFLFLFGSATITISMIAVYRLGNPLGRFQEATLRLAGDLDAPPLDERRGVSEVRAVARTLNAMQARLKNYLAERTTMLAA
ncbi:MAG: HAMP domain-containing protein, partial [Pseudomonadota bacterium]|nr:HAMP domain-containing protein [Pseudomonadota bacterium]